MLVSRGGIIPGISTRVIDVLTQKTALKVIDVLIHPGYRCVETYQVVYRNSIVIPHSESPNPQSTIPLPLSPFQLISENGEIVLLARFDQKEGMRGLLYPDNIICL
jgi:hypothetical protein